MCVVTGHRKMSANPDQLSPFPGVFPSRARSREVAVVVFYLCIGGTVAELAVDGWMACSGSGRLFFDDTFVFVTVVMFDHCPMG